MRTSASHETAESRGFVALRSGYRAIGAPIRLLILNGQDASRKGAPQRRRGDQRFHLPSYRNSGADFSCSRVAFIVACHLPSASIYLIEIPDGSTAA